MAQTPLADILVAMGRSLVSFDVPGAYRSTREPDFWRIVSWGMRLNGGRGNLALHKRLQNLMERPRSLHRGTRPLFTDCEGVSEYETGGVNELQC